MRYRNRKPVRIIMMIFTFILLSFSVFAQEDIIPFDSDRWELRQGSRILEHEGQKCLFGSAVLKDVVFKNGIIEMDVFSDGSRGFGGFNFRIQSNDDYEHFYVRPHKTRLPDAVQYTPVFNGMSSWQLYNGTGFTNAVEIPHNKWFHLKMEISGTQAKAYLDERLVLIITDLKHGESEGKLGIFYTPPGNIYFANFKYRENNDLKFGPPPKTEMPLGMITDWELSQAFNYVETDNEKYPDKEMLSKIKWQKVRADKYGLVDISRYVRKNVPEAVAVYARSSIQSDKDQTFLIKFGYSDVITIFVNGKPAFTGISNFRSRDAGFQGILSPLDFTYLPLKKGKNELMLFIGEVFGGWGFMCQNAHAVYEHGKMKKIREVSKKFRMPESVVYDKKRDVLYVSNFDRDGRAGVQFISKLSKDGKIIELKWIEGVAKPTGMLIHDDKLYAVERTNMVEIDIDAGKIINKYPITGARFINDIAVDKNGNFYISDSNGGCIFKFSEGKSEVWLKNEETSAPNGLLMDGDNLIIGISSNGSLKSIDLKTKAVKTIVSLGAGAIMDGIQHDGKGNYLFSDFYGRLYHLTRSGEKTLLLNTKTPQLYLADFEYIPDENLFIIPTLYDNRIMWYKYK